MIRLQSLITPGTQAAVVKQLTVKMGLAERFLRSEKLLTWLVVATIALFGLFLAFSMDPLVSVTGALTPPLVLCAVGVRVHDKTGRWWFVSLRNYRHFNPPSYNITVGDFWELVDS